MLIREGRIPHFLSDEEWYAKHKKTVTEESASPPARQRVAEVFDVGDQDLPAAAA